MNSSEENLVVEVRFEIEKDAEGYPKSRDYEALLCKPLNSDCSVCVVANVPFYLRDVAYGDTIRTKDDSSGSLRFGLIIRRSGYSVYRIFLHDATKKENLINQLLDFGALVEQDGDLIAFALPPDANADAVVDRVLEGKHEGWWGAQDGYIHEPPNAGST